MWPFWRTDLGSTPISPRLGAAASDAWCSERTGVTHAQRLAASSSASVRTSSGSKRVSSATCRIAVQRPGQPNRRPTGRRGRTRAIAAAAHEQRCDERSRTSRDDAIVGARGGGTASSARCRTMIDGAGLARRRDLARHRNTVLGGPSAAQQLQRLGLSPAGVDVGVGHDRPGAPPP